MIQYPERIVIELASYCNLSCSMCDRSLVKNSSPYMSKDRFKAYIDQVVLDGFNPVVLPFWRGESCTHPYFVDLLEYALSKGVRIHLSTNGHFMEKQFVDIFYRCEFINFSAHNDRGIKSTLKFVENKPDWSKTDIQVSFVENEKTVAKYCSSIVSSPTLKGFDSVRYYEVHDQGQLQNLKDFNSFQGACMKLQNTLVLDVNGSISRCAYIWNDAHENNSNNDISIQDLWNGFFLNDVRRNYPDNICGNCDQWAGKTTGKAWRIGQDKKVEYIKT